jgi:chorismate synthase
VAGNSIGTIFRVTTWGESHGLAVGATVDGCPAGIPLSEEDVQRDLDRRKPGQSSVTTPRKEEDKVQILSGVFENVTTGTPVTMVVHNAGAEPGAYEAIKDVYRPGHADYTYEARYGIRDYRGGGRSSGRETAGRVAAGAIARKFLSMNGILIIGHTLSVGRVSARGFYPEAIERNPVRSADPEAVALMVDEIEKARREGDSIGGSIQIIVQGVPAGLGEPVFDKLDADIAKAVMSIGGIKAVAIGAGLEAPHSRGSEFNDAFMSDHGRIRTRTNNAGGIIGGISTGEDVVVTLAVKPTPSVSRQQQTVDRNGQPREIEIRGRHDPCLCPRIVPVAEAMLAIVLADHLLRLRSARA